jgi:uncharacterized protein YxjI
MMHTPEYNNQATADRLGHPFTVPRGPLDSHPHYLVREANLPLGDDYVIEREPGGRVFVVDGKLLRVRESVTIRDKHGTESCHIRGTLLGVKNVLKISRDDATIATVRMQASESAPVRYAVELPQGESVTVTGSPADRAYTLSYGGYIVATITSAWMPMTRGYRVLIAPEQDNLVVLAVTICLDVMSRT